MNIASILLSRLLLGLMLVTSFSCRHVPRVNVMDVQLQEQPNGDLVGEVDRAVLANGRYEWFNRNYNAYQPNPEIIEYLQQYADDIHAEVYIGTWCPDTHRDFPLFMRVADEAGIPHDNITIYGLDRVKSSGDNRAVDMGITRVPTFVLFYDNREISRVTENFSRGPEVYLMEIYSEEFGEEDVIENIGQHEDDIQEIDTEELQKAKSEDK